MFIKILTPNPNGKIELTVEDLETLIDEAVEKNIKEKCSNCNHRYYGGVTYANAASTIALDKVEDAWDSYKITCASDSLGTEKSTKVDVADTTIANKTSAIPSIIQKERKNNETVKSNL